MRQPSRSNLTITPEHFERDMAEAFEQARNMASEIGHTEFSDTHLLLALIDHGGGRARCLLESSGSDPGTLRDELIRSLHGLPRARGAGIHAQPAPELPYLLQVAGAIMAREGAHRLGIDHVLIALASAENFVGRALRAYASTPDTLLRLARQDRADSREEP